MGALEIVLLIVGVLLTVAGFLIPAKINEADEVTKEMVVSEVKQAVSREVEGMKQRMEEITDESIQYAMEKTERSLERVSNEKIMAVNEYSDTVLEEIDKNHKEVMFLYDMLNDKHENFKQTVTEAQIVVHAMNETKKELEERENNEFVSLKPVKITDERVLDTPVATPEVPLEIVMDVNEEPAPLSGSNEHILSLHNAGKSSVEIAMMLGRGVGEVQLVIDLYEGMKS